MREEETVASLTKAERGKTNIEVTEETRQKLKLLAALLGMKMADAAAEAVDKLLFDVQQPGGHRHA
jgi:hypothetical protein